MAFKKPYAIGSFTERGSWHRADKVKSCLESHVTFLFQDIWPLYRMNLMCRTLPQNITIFSLVKSAKGVEIFPSKNQQELTLDNSNSSIKTFLKKSSRDEDNLKVKLLKNKTEDIKEFDKEKHLIKSFIMKSKKQEREIQRDRKIIFGKVSRGSSNNSTRSFATKQDQTSNQMVPIEVI